jgi:hypothetical protein
MIKHAGSEGGGNNKDEGDNKDIFKMIKAFKE